MKRLDESQTSYSIRMICAEKWREGHDCACIYSLSPCDHHPNPYGDDEVTA